MLHFYQRKVSRIVSRKKHVQENKHVMFIFFDFMAVDKYTYYAIILVVITNYGIR